MPNADVWTVAIDVEWNETRYGMRGQRIGEAKNPGPGSQRRRTQRLRALQRALDSDSESDVEAQGLEVSAFAQQVSASLRAPPRLRIVGTQRDTDGDNLHSTVPAALPLPTWVDMSRGDDSPRVIQAVDPDTESVASSGFLRMFGQDLEADSAMLPPTWLETQENDEVVDSVVPESSPSRRVVLVPQSPHGSRQSLGDRHVEDSGDERPFADHVRLPDSDTETVGAVSDVSAHEPTVESEVVVPVEEVTISLVLRDALRYLDLDDVSNIFQRRASVMRSPPKFLCGAFRSAMRVALQEIVRGAERRDERAQCRGWKLFLLLPRMLLFNIPKQRLVDRFTAFSQGDWELLLRESEGCDGAASQGFQRRRRNQIVECHECCCI